MLQQHEGDDNAEYGHDCYNRERSEVAAGDIHDP